MLEIKISGLEEILKRLDAIEPALKRVATSEVMELARTIYARSDVARSYPFKGGGGADSEVQPSQIPSALVPDLEAGTISIDQGKKSHERELRRHETYGAVSPLLLMRQHMASKEWHDKVTAGMLKMLGVR